MNTRTRNYQDLFTTAATVLLLFSPMLPPPLTVVLAATLLAIGIACRIATKPARQETSG